MRRSTIIIVRWSSVLLLVLVAVLISFVSLKTTHAATQTTYYVSPTGSDSNSGTDINHPFATINHARQVVEAVNSNMSGDIVVYLLSGTYHESLTYTARDSGTNGHNVIYKAYPGATPVLSGGKRITGWTLHDSTRNIWQASIPAGFDTRQLYVNGVRANRATSAALPAGTTQNSTGYIIPNKTLQNITSPTDLEFVYNKQWLQSRCDVRSISGTATQTTVTMIQPCYGMITSWYWVPMGLPTYLENAYEFLAHPGDWSIDTAHHVISYIPRSGENLATADIEVGNTQTLLTLNGTPASPVQHLIFQGITFAYTTWLQASQDLGVADAQANFLFPDLVATQNWNNTTFVTPTGGHTWNNTPYGSSAVGMPGAVEVQAALNVQFLGNFFTHLGAVGLDINGGSQNDTFTGNSFTDISGNGIQISSVANPNASQSRINRNDTFNDNYIDHVCVEFTAGVGIFIGYASHILLTHNEISNVPYSAISLGWGWGSEDTLPSVDTGNIISDNYTHDVMQQRIDGGCIYTLGPQPRGVISGNFCLRDENVYGAIYLDQGTTGIAVNSNVIEQSPKTRWLNPNPNSFDTPGNTANGNYTDNSNYGSHNVTITNTTVFADNSVPTAAQTIIANAGLEAAYKYLAP